LTKNTLSPNIQILRAISVCFVVLYHFDSEFFKLGYLGVDVFFVVSGFVITSQLEAIAISKSPNLVLKSFFSKRLRRLAPALGIVLVTMSLLMIIIGPLSELRFFSLQGAASLLFVANFSAYRLSQENYFNPNPNGLIHTWSLSAEEQIYFLLPFVMIAYYKIRVNFKYVYYELFTFTYIGYKLLLINPYNLFNLTALTNPNLLFYLPISRIWEFFIGSIAFTLLNKKTDESLILFKSKRFNSSCFLAILASYYAGLPELVSVSTAIFILYSYKAFSKPTLLNGILTWLGDRSYVIYLVHMPIIFILHNSPILQVYPRILINFFSVLTILTLTQFISSNWENQFRSGGKFEKVGWKKIMLLFVVIPFLFLSSLRFGSVTFFGAAKPPTLQGTISCVEPGIYGECITENQNSQGELILLGDSHAAAISKTVEKIAKDLNLDFILMSGRGCQMLPITNKHSYEIIYKSPKNCEEFLHNVAQLLKSRPEAQVLLSQRSVAIQENSNSSYLNLKIQGIEQLKQSNPNIILVGSVPELRPSLHQGIVADLMQEKVTVRRDLLLPQSFWEDTKMKKEMGIRDINYISTVDIICNVSNCLIKSGNEYLYWDENHLSLEGAVFLHTEIHRALLGLKARS
jgi:peptidoglycan/LPS O-acetylase OafA/YrhL